MYEYSSVRSSSYDLEGLIASLNAKDTEGWEVVSVVPAGGELAAILRRSSNNGSRAGDETEPASQVTPAEVAAVASTAPAIDAAAATAPSPEAQPVQEAAGWGAVAEPVASSPNPWADNAAAATTTTAAPTPEPAPTPVASAPPTEAQSAVPTTPAGWYPDPSSRFEMRYWDGNGWTEHVARGGQQFTDPPVA